MNNTVPESNVDSAQDREENVTYSDEISNVLSNF